jgi:broad specificity phosphatase PhoE
MNRSIFIIRHGEKPPDGKPGIDDVGGPNEHSLIAVGWERAKALPRLFAGAVAWFPQPTQLIVPDHHGPDPEPKYRTYQTLMPLADLIGLSIEPREPHEAKLAEELAEATAGVTLVSWAHEYIPKLAEHIPTDGVTTPRSWPDHRFDVVWVFEATGKGTYAFSQVPQMLLPGDKESTI